MTEPLFTVTVEDDEVAGRLAASADFQTASATLQEALTKLYAIGPISAELAPVLNEAFAAALELQKRANAEANKAWGEALVADAFAKGLAAGKGLQPATTPPIVVNFDPGAIQATIALPNAPLRVQVERQETATRIERDASGALTGLRTLSV